MIVPVDDPDDPRLAQFRLNDRGLASRADKRDDAGAGLFLAEGDLVVERALAAGCRPVAALVDGDRIPPVACAGRARRRRVRRRRRAAPARHRARRRRSRSSPCSSGRRGRPSPSCSPRRDRLVIVEGVDNPANVGAIVRNAAGARMGRPGARPHQRRSARPASAAGRDGHGVHAPPRPRDDVVATLDELRPARRRHRRADARPRRGRDIDDVDAAGRGAPSSIGSRAGRAVDRRRSARVPTSAPHPDGTSASTRSTPPPPSAIACYVLRRPASRSA